jgi:hypothetical protein
VAAGPQDAHDLIDPENPTRLDDQVEHLVGVGEGARFALLEGDPPLGIETDPGDGTVHRLSGPINAAHACGRELTGEEKHPVTLATADLQGSLRSRDLENGGGQRRQGGSLHGIDDLRRGSQRAIL